MSTSLMYHTQLIQGLKQKRYVYQGNKVTQTIQRKKIRCPHCNSRKVTASKMRTRLVQGPPCVIKEFWFQFDVHRVYCRKCKLRNVENFDFLSHPKARITKAFERTIIELRSEMSIIDIHKFYGVEWRTIKKSRTQTSQEKVCKDPTCWRDNNRYR